MAGDHILELLSTVLPGTWSELDQKWRNCCFKDLLVQQCHSTSLYISYCGKFQNVNTQTEFDSFYIIIHYIFCKESKAKLYLNNSNSWVCPSISQTMLLLIILEKSGILSRCWRQWLSHCLGCLHLILTCLLQVLAPLYPNQFLSLGFCHHLGDPDWGLSTQHHPGPVPAAVDIGKWMENFPLPCLCPHFCLSNKMKMKFFKAGILIFYWKISQIITSICFLKHTFKQQLTLLI